MTIEEMSIKFANEIYGENMIEDGWLKARYFYERGAKAVLEEIEDIVYRRYSEDADGTERNRDIINLIRHLKGGDK